MPCSLREWAKVIRPLGFEIRECGFLGPFDAWAAAQKRNLFQRALRQSRAQINSADAAASRTLLRLGPLLHTFSRADGARSGIEALGRAEAWDGFFLQNRHIHRLRGELFFGLFGDAAVEADVEADQAGEHEKVFRKLPVKE